MAFVRITGGSVLLLVWLLVQGCPQQLAGDDDGDDDTTEDPLPFEPLFTEEFDAILARLRADFWSEDGDWVGDMQGDATAFAPTVLYPIGEEREDAELIAMATATVDHEVSLVMDLVASGVLSMDAVIGAPALAEGYRHTGDDAYRFAFLAGTTVGYELISTQPEQFLPFVFDLATVYGTGAYLCLSAAELSGEAQYMDMALDLIAQANDEVWDDDAGMYEWTQVADWPQATMAMSLATAYRLTGEPAHLARAERVLAGMEACCWDADRGGWWAAEDIPGKGLSGNNNMAWALLDMAAATGEAAYLERTRETLAWMLTEDLYSAGERTLYHHWYDEGTPDPGRADTFCTGCNFQALCNIHRFNRLSAGARRLGEGE